MRRYRFFFHYRRYDDKMSVHFKGQCYPVDKIECLTPCCSKRNKRQPFLVMQGFAKEVRMNNLVGGKVRALIL